MPAGLSGGAAAQGRNGSDWYYISANQLRMEHRVFAERKDGPHEMPLASALASSSHLDMASLDLDQSTPFNIIKLYY